MSKKMLIDATHEEETRVAIVDGNTLVEFDYESSVRKQLKGGIYLAKVTRVEPSLQAAFVNFGGNRHGFLPFSEIHPDYFRIPVSDREALIAAQQEELAKLDEIEDDEDDIEEDVEALLEGDTEAEYDEDDIEEDVVEVGGADKPADEEDSDLMKAEEEKADSKKKKPTKSRRSKKSDEIVEEDNAEDNAEEPSTEMIGNSKSDNHEKSDEELDAEALAIAQNLDPEQQLKDGENNRRDRDRSRRGDRGRGRNFGGKKPRSAMQAKKPDEMVDDNESGKPFRFNLRHKYKIQEVVKRGQIMLIQVSKEERGNKGAAVTTYMSLPGRYCVLMPNSPRGGGVSRKIGNFKERKRMREILKELTIPNGMSVILRTAGVARTKTEIKRDLDYLTRLWNTIREETLKSSAPALINEEGNLIKRSIRDLYAPDIDDVVVSGDRGFKTAKEFMKMLVPSHAKKVKEYKDDRVPLFHRYNVEKQISLIGEISVTLKSGGYLVINPTEALVSVDVNSGKATKERHIEETALKTNMEAAEEVARQLRLRDLGGLVVIDFIDMEERRNNRKVENKLRDALAQDRARIQVGRISSFGLLELSRQRLNPSLTESQFEKCPHCDGRGIVKTLDFAAISAMRALEEEGIKGRISELSLNVPNNVAVYILNNKRQLLADIEKRYDFRVHIRVDENLKASEFRLDPIKQKKSSTPSVDKEGDEESDKEEIIEVVAKEKPFRERSTELNDDGEERPKKGRRRGRRGGRRHNKKEDGDEVASNDSQPAERNSGDRNKAESKPVEAKTSDVKPAEAKKSAPVSKPAAEPKKASNDTKAVKEQRVKDFEVINEAPKSKKKGWWNRLVE